MNVPRGVTLFELLATLSLLTILSIVSVSWMTTVLRSQSISTSQASWHRASVAVLDLIGQDILVVDRLDTRERSNTPRITVEDNILRIRTRSYEAVGTHLYSLDHGLSELHRQYQGQQRQATQIALIGEAQAFVCELMLPSVERAMPILTVSLVANDGREIHRTYVLDREDVQ